MTSQLNQLALWLADFYLLSTILLAAAVVSLFAIRQPVRRRAVAQATICGLIALAALCAIPGRSVVNLTSADPAEAPVVQTAPPVESQRPIDLSYADWSEPDSAIVETQTAPQQPLAVNAPPAQPPAKQFDSLATRAISWQLLGVLAWSIGAVAALVWLALGWFAARRLIRHATPAPGDIAALLDDVLKTSMSARERLDVSLFTSTRINVAVALGVWRPAVLLPKTWVAEPVMQWRADRGERVRTLPIPLPKREGQSSAATSGSGNVDLRHPLRTVLAHEAAHLRNRDLHWLALCRALHVVLWAQPLYWFLRRRLRLDQEALADAAAAELTTRQRYAEQLVAWAHVVAARPTLRLSTAVGLWEGPSQLRQRIAILIDDHFTVLRQCSRGWRVGSIGLCAFATLALSLFTLQPGTSRVARAEEPAVSKKEGVAAEGGDAKPQAAVVKTETLKVRVLDEDGVPLENVTVTPWALRVGGENGIGGGHMLWLPGMKGFPDPSAVKTDKSGNATITYPQGVPVTKQAISQVSLEFKHPEFVFNQAHVSIQNKISTVRMERGGFVEVVARAGNETIRENLLGQGGPLGGEVWTLLKNGKLRSGPLAPGTATFRIAWLPKDGPAQFGPSLPCAVEAGETSSVDTLLSPGARLTGKLDNRVPRPVKNGFVVASIKEPHDINWEDWTSINEDGTFEFASLPGGNGVTAQLIAMCDGFASEPPPGSNDADQMGRPQVVSLKGDTATIDMPMIPTASARIKFTEADGRPIPGVTISFCPNVQWSTGASVFGKMRLLSSDLLGDPEAWRKAFAAQSSQQAYQATSDDSGIAHVRNVPPFGPSFATVQHDHFQLPAAGPIMGGARMAEVKLEPGKQIEMEIVLEPTAAEVKSQKVAKNELAGTVLGPDGKPLEGVTVDAWTWYPGNETKTDARGHFRLKKFEADSNIEIEFRKEGFEPRYFVNQPTGTPGWTINMDNRTFLEGNVTDPQGKPVAGAVIRAERGPFNNDSGVIGEVATEVTSDDKGHYRLYLEPAAYEIKVRVPGRGVARFEKQAIAAGEQKDFPIKLNAGLALRAKVIDSVSGKPVEGFTLWSWRLKGIEGTSNADGLLEVPELFPGKIEFNVTAKGENRRTSSVAGQYARWWSEQALNEHQRKKSEPDGFQRNLDDLEFEIKENGEPVTIYVEPCVTITGRIVDPDGKPVAGATVAPAKTGSGNSLTGDTRYSYQTKEDGTFAMKLPASGGREYNLIAHDGKYGQWRKWANAIEEPFSTKAGDKLNGVELKLTRPTTVRGRVMIDENTPAVGHEVRAAGVLNYDNRYYLPTTKTDAEGRYELKFVNPGQQRIQIEPFWLDPGEGPNGTTHIIDIKEGETLDDVDFKVPMQEAPNGQLFFNVVPQPAPAPAAVKVQDDAAGNPKDAEALMSSADELQKSGEFKKAIAELEKLIELKPSGMIGVFARNNLAFILSTAADDSLRDGKRAVALAEKARDSSPNPQPDIFDTLAAAYAEAGEWDKAVEAAQQAIKADPKNDKFRKHLALYQEKKPLRVEAKPAPQAARILQPALIPERE